MKNNTNKLLDYMECNYVKDILNSMSDWVRIIDPDSKILYANDAMKKDLKRDPTGDICYHAIEKNSKCENCISQKAFENTTTFRKEEIVGGKCFNVSSSPIKNDEGCITAVVEVLRDVTKYKNLQENLKSKNSQLKNNLSFAKTIQNKLLPWDFKSNDVNFSFKYIPSEYLSGDLLDIFYIDDTHIGLYIADVSGHGVSSALLTVYIYSKFNKKELSPSKTLENLFIDFNSTNMNEDLYITIFYMIIDIEKNTITYSNAGHSAPPIIFNRENFLVLRSPGIPISNWLESPEYIEHKKMLSKKDKIFFYTDGITELRKPDCSKQFSEERMLKIIQSSIFDIEMTLEILIEEIYKFNNSNKNFNDDITLALLEL
jgi:sigma-B regulation protein RsbU (phosphoserine phosphatase)